MIIGFIIPDSFFIIEVVAKVAATDVVAVAPAATKISGSGIGTPKPKISTTTTPSISSCGSSSGFSSTICSSTFGSGRLG
ncbi:MAG: hypothetical protein ACO23R_17160 [bacterium]